MVAISGLTALQGLRDRGKVERGQKVLIIGASGGVGTYAVQIAKAFGADVTGVCSTTKVDMVRSLGADHVIDYTRDDFAEGEQRYDVILDIGGNASLVTPPARPHPEGDARHRRRRDRRPVARRQRSPAPGARCCRRSWARSWRTFVASENHEDLIVLKELIEAGKVTPVIDRTYPLSEAADAIRYLRGGTRPRKGRHHRVMRASERAARPCSLRSSGVERSTGAERLSRVAGGPPKPRLPGHVRSAAP